MSDESETVELPLTSDGLRALGILHRRGVNHTLDDYTPTHANHMAFEGVR